jgi:PPOX class probable F420-dependent enzyme
MDVIQSKYLLLTTFTKDGRPKPTPIWGVPDGDKLLVITDDGSWKTRRINNTPRVTIAKSAALGKPKSEEVEAVARVLSEVGDTAGLQRRAEAVLVPRPLVLCALHRAWRHRQGARRPRDKARGLGPHASHCLLAFETRGPGAAPLGCPAEHMAGHSAVADVEGYER